MPLKILSNAAFAEYCP